MTKRLSKAKRNRAIKKIIKAGDRHENRNKLAEERRKNTVNTRAFRTPQSFGAASDCIIIDPKQYMKLTEERDDDS